MIERASLIVGADGRNSGPARAVEAAVYNQVPPILCYYFSYWSGVAAQTFELYVRNEQRRVLGMFSSSRTNVVTAELPLLVEDELILSFVMEDHARLLAMLERKA